MEIVMQLVEEKWSEILLTVKREHELTDISFNTWLKPLQIFSIQNNRIFVLVSSEQMGLTYISKKYYLPLKVAVAEITGGWNMRLNLFFRNRPENSKCRIRRGRLRQRKRNGLI